MNEYNITKKLSSEYCIKAYDYFHDMSRDKFYIILEYVEGSTLENIVHEETLSGKIFV